MIPKIKPVPYANICAIRGQNIQRKGGYEKWKIKKQTRAFAARLTSADITVTASNTARWTAFRSAHMKAIQPSRSAQTASRLKVNNRKVKKALSVSII
jgi:hypothetical protein